jgi:hypothetical protein
MDLQSSLKVVNVVKPHSPAATGTITGIVVDTAGFNSVTFIAHAGLQTSTDVLVVPIVKSGTVTSSLSAEDDANLVGSTPTGQEAAANLSGTAGASSTTKVGYIGSNRYVSCDLSVIAAATGTYGISCILGNPIKAPQGQS